MMNAQVENEYVKAVLGLRRAVRQLIDAEKKLAEAEQDYFQSGNLPAAKQTAHIQPQSQGVPV